MRTTSLDYPKNALIALLLAAALPSFGQITSDLVCSYPPSTASAWGGQANAEATMANGVIGSNALNDQTGTGAGFNIVGYIMSSRDSVGEGNNNVLGLLASDPSYADVRNYAASVGADQVVYAPYASTGSAGNAYQPGVYSSISSTWWWLVVVAHETGGHNYGRSHNDGMVTPKTIMLHNYCGGGAAWPYFYTDPNIWWNGTQMLSTLANDCSNGWLPNGGDNSSYSAQWMQNQSDHIAIGPALNNVVLRWCFTNAPGSAPASTTNLDKAANAPAVVRGNGATYTGSALRIPGGTTGNVAMSSMSAYIDLPNGIISSQTNLTIEIWAAPLSAPNYSRIMDFGRCTEAGDGLGAPGEYTGAVSDPAPGSTTGYDAVLLSDAVGTDITQQLFAIGVGGTMTYYTSGLATTAGVQHHYAITFTDGVGIYTNNGGSWKWYRDGFLVDGIDVSNHLSNIHDVNNWLGRSQWSGDSNANNDYAEVRISNVAMSQRQLLANYTLGPNYNLPANMVIMTNSDAWGAASFNAAGQWNGGAAPASGKNYQTYNYRMLTPATSSSYTFAGSSLNLGGAGAYSVVPEAGLFWGGTASSTITVNNLMVNNAQIHNRGTGTFTLAGNMTVTNVAYVNAMNNAVNLSANLGGNGAIAYVGNQGTLNGLITTYSGNQVTLAGNNSSYTGRTVIGLGAGAAGGLTIDSEARLGANPAALTANQLSMNRGTLTTTTTMSLTNANRGILLDVNGGGFNVAFGTTLTLGCQLFSPTIAGGATGGNLNKSGAGTLVITSTNSAFNGMLYVDSGSSANDGVVRLVNNLTMANAHSVHVRNSGSGSSTLQLDGSAGSIALPVVYLNGRSSTTPAIESLAGTNTLAGGINTYGSGSCLVQADAGVLNVGGTITTSDGGADTITFQGSGTVNLNGTVLNGGGTMSVNKAGSGTLNFAAGSSYSGTTTVGQGTLALQPLSTTPVLHLTFNNAAGSGNGSVITNTGSGGAAMNGRIVSTGGASIVSGGRFGNALSLNGTGGSASNNIVIITNSVVNTDAAGTWTVGYWIKTSTAGAVIMYQGDGTWSSSGQTTFLLNASSGSTAGTHAGAVRWAGGFLTGTAALNNGAWHFVTLVDNAGSETIFVDGSADAVTSTMGLPLSTGANQIWIGGAPDTDAGAVKMTGQIDEVYLFNRALNQAEIQSLYNNNAITNSPVNTLPVATTLTVAAGGVLDLAGVSQTVAGVSGGGVVTNTGGAATLTVSNASGSTLFSGKIGDASAANAINLVETGSGTTVFAGANNYHGATTVNAGTLKLSPVVDDSVLHLTFNNAAGSGNGTIVTNIGLGGTNFNGTLTGTASIVIGGRFGNALNIPSGAATAAYVLVTNAVVPLNATAGNNWSVGLWLKTSMAGAAYFYQGDGGWASGNTEFYLENGTAGDGAGFHAGGVRYAQGWESGTATINNGQWHFVMMTCNNGAKTQYVDGALDALMVDQWGDVGTGGQVRIGGAASGADSQIALGGLMDEFYMFNRALSQSEVQALYSNNSLSTNTGNVLPATTPVSVASGATLDLGGVSQTIASLSGSGSVTNTASGPATLTVSNSTGTATFGGSIGDTSSANAVSFVQNGGATNILTGTNTYRGATVVNGGALFVNGSLGSGVVTNGALLGGNGTLGGALTVKSGGTLSPGTGVGKLMVNSSVTLQSGSTTFMEISKSPKTNDQLIASGALNYGGTLVVTNLGGTLAAGDSFVLFQAGSFNGSFASNSLPPLSAGLGWNTAALGSGILNVIQATPTNLVWSVSGTNLTLSWPSDRIGWRLLVQTNNLAGGISQNTNDWGTVSNSQQTNQIVLPVGSALPQEFYRLVYP